MDDEAVFYGRWHVGGDGLPTWTPQPTSGFLAGSIADVGRSMFAGLM